MQDFFIMSKKTKLILLLLLLLVLSAFLSTPYRDYIYAHNIDDFGLADVGGNIFVVAILSIISWLGVFKLSNNKILDVFINTGIYLLLEVGSYFFPYIGTFDVKDLLVLPLGTLIALFALYAIKPEDFNSHFKNLRTNLSQVKERVFPRSFY